MVIQHAEQPHSIGEFHLNKIMTSKIFYEKSERRKRISIDIDQQHLRSDPFKVQRVFFILKQFFPNACISVKKTKNGFHVKAVGEDIASISIVNRVNLREQLGDDPLRIEAERLKLRTDLIGWVETLFTLKRYSDGSYSKPEEINPFAIPWITQLPTKKSMR